MRIIAATLALIMLCSCSVRDKKPPVIADGFSCTVTADYGSYQTQFSLKKEGESLWAEYLSPDDLAGLKWDISPAGNFIGYGGITDTLSDDLLASSLIGAIIIALKTDFAACDYQNGAYCCDAFILSLFSDGRISSINFPEYSCKCYFNY